MTLTPELKTEIDGMSLYKMLAQWRFHQLGSPMFEGESGKYFKSIMFTKRDANPEEWVAASKDFS